MANKTPNFNAPLGFKEILHDFAREVLKFHPDDILEFGADYFESLIQVYSVFILLSILSLKGKLLENDPKYINLREKPHLKELAEKKIISKENEQKVENN